jgi:hypothetical protein
MRSFTRLLAGTALVATGFTAVATVGTANASGVTSTCRSLTKTIAVLSGYTPTGPKYTAYNYAAGATNLPHALGTTVDFGPNAVVVSCLAPSDLTKLATKLHKPAFTPATFLTYLTTTTPSYMSGNILGYDEYSRMTTGAAAGIGSLAHAAKLRLDAFAVATNYVLIVQSVPGIVTPSYSLKNFILNASHAL